MRATTRALIVATLSLVAARATRAVPSGRKVVAVFDLELSGVHLSRAARERLSAYLAAKIASSPHYQVVPRDQLRERLRREKRESYKRCYDQSCQIAIGRELAAQKSVSTKVLRLGRKCAVTMTLYDLRRSTTDRAADATGGCRIGGLVRSIETAANKLVGAEIDPMTAALQPLHLPHATRRTHAMRAVVDPEHCPRGTRRMGAPPPAGQAIFCVNRRGLREGPSIFWDRRGKKLSVSMWHENRRVGPSVRWHPNGKLRERVNYVDDKRQGRYLRWDKYGNKREIGRYERGIKVGVWTQYWRGKLHAKTTYDNGYPDGYHATYDSDGAKRSEGYYRDGRQVGVWTEYWHGKPRTKTTYKDGHPDGYFAQFSDGRKRIEGNYKEGLKSGVWTYRDGRGRPTMRGTFRHGRYEGRWVNLDPRTGRVTQAGRYHGGKKVGVWTAYRCSGAHPNKRCTIKYEGRYVDGKREGRWRFFTRGRLISEQTYHRGKANGLYVTYGRNGNKLMEGHYKDGRPNGRFLQYDGGRVVHELLYRDGRRVSR